MDNSKNEETENSGNRGYEKPLAQLETSNLQVLVRFNNGVCKGAGFWRCHVKKGERRYSHPKPESFVCPINKRRNNLE
uniref:Uncharacterized protein n=1 Tax=Noccaea caerulescens TaxID=107243 RepID=A0A1J3DAZ8_NOCCA